MVAGTVVAWRHGQTDYNAAGRLQGQVDIPLNEVGREQARVAAPVLADLRPTAIVSSDLGRARETAAVVAELCGVSVVTDPRLRERSFGAWEGHYDHHIRANWPEQAVAWREGLPLEGIGAEQRGEVGLRFAAAVEEHACGLASDETLLVVAHGACIALGLITLLGLDAETWAGLRGIGNCHWSVLGASEREPRWRLLSHNIAAVAGSAAPG